MKEADSQVWLIFSVIVCVGNLLMAEICGRVADAIGFEFKDTRENYCWPDSSFISACARESTWMSLINDLHEILQVHVILLSRPPLQRLHGIVPYSWLCFPALGSIYMFQAHTIQFSSFYLPA